MIGLIDDRLSNMVGLGYAAQSLNPVSQQMLQSVGEMLMSEFDEDVSATRREIFNEIHEMRYNWANVMNDMVEQISLAAQQQSEVSSEIARNVDILSVKEVENAEWMGSCHQELQELTDTASSLNKVVGRFKI